MGRTITVVTPENIPVTYQAAGIASRFMAVIVDLIIQITLAFLVLLGIRTIVGQGGHSGIGPASILSALGILFVLFVIPFVYSIFFEMIWAGRTPGKRLFGLRVVRDGGYPINLLSSTVRNVLRIIDFGIIPLATPLVLCGFPGLICMFFSPTYKRIGDYAAGTLVIVEGGVASLEGARTTSAVAPSTAIFLPLVKNLDRITQDEYRMIRRFTTRRNRFELMVQAALAERIARPLLAKLEMDAPIVYQLQYADVLQAIETRYAEDHGVL